MTNNIGISIDASSNNSIGAAGAGNLISGNTASGISITAGANGNQVLGNLIGTNLNGGLAVGNGIGIIIDSSSNNIVGGTANGDPNVISGNNTIGIQISNASATANLVEGNMIGTNKAGNTAFTPTANVNTGFPIGIIINDSSANVIGGTMPGAGNVIAGFGVGIDISAFGASGNMIQDNQIGVGKNGHVLPKTIGIGIYFNGAGDNTVGGATSAAGNQIKGYLQYGIYVFGSQSTGDVIEGNQIGQQVSNKELGAKTPTEQLAGIAIQGASKNILGGATRAEGNTIQGNADGGVYIFGQANSASNNQIKNNDFNNNSYGILLYNAPNNGQYFTLRQTNRYGKNTIADVREFTGAVPGATKTSRKAATSAREQGHRDVCPHLRRIQRLEPRDAGGPRKG